MSRLEEHSKAKEEIEKALAEVERLSSKTISDPSITWPQITACYARANFYQNRLNYLQNGMSLE